MFVIKARFCNNGKLLLGKYQNGICPADPTGPGTVLLQATFSLIHAFRGIIVTPRASLRRNPARRTRRFFALSTFRWETVLIPPPRIENSLSPPYRGYRLFNSHRDFCLGACTPLTSEARPRIFKNRVRAHRYIHVSSKVHTYLVH